MRDRLIELIRKADKKGLIFYRDNEAELSFANLILDDGWMRPSCKVGQTIYVNPKTWRTAYSFINYDHIFIDRQFYIVADVVAIIKTRKQTLVKLGTYNTATFTREYERYPISAIGKTVFLTREEAEKALQSKKTAKSTIEGVKIRSE